MDKFSFNSIVNQYELNFWMYFISRRRDYILRLSIIQIIKDIHMQPIRKSYCNDSKKSRKRPNAKSQEKGRMLKGWANSCR